MKLFRFSKSHLYEKLEILENERILAQIKEVLNGGRNLIVKQIENDSNEFYSGFYQKKKNIIQETVLHYAHSIHNEEKLKLLVDKGVKAGIIDNLAGYKGRDGTALVCAVKNGNAKLAELLLDAGAKVDINYFKQETALHFLDRINDHAVKEKLIKRYSEVGMIDNKDQFGKTALIHSLHLTKYIKIIDLTDTKLLLKYGAKFETITNSNEISINGQHIPYFESISKDILHMKNQSIHKHCNENDYEALKNAAWRSDTAKIKFLLELGLDVSLRKYSHDEPTILHWISEITDIEILRPLVNQCKKVGVLDNEHRFGCPAILESVRNENKVFTELLLKAGANGNDALTTAFRSCSLGMVWWLLRQDIEFKIQPIEKRIFLHKFIHICLSYKDTKFEDLLWQKEILEKCVNPEIINLEQIGETLLSLALKGENDFLIGFLLNNGALIRKEDVILGNRITSPITKEIFFEMCLEQGVIDNKVENFIIGDDLDY